MDFSQLMNVTMDYDDEVECKATHPTILDTNEDDDIVFLPHNWNIPKADPNTVHRIVLGSGLKEVRWESS